MGCGEWAAVGDYYCVDVGVTCPGYGTMYPGVWWADDVDYVGLD